MLTRKKIAEASLLFGMIISVFCAGTCAGAQAYSDVTSTVFRLHILANSNSEADQALKLRVRDAVLQKGSDIFEGCTSSEQAAAKAEQKLDFLRETAERVVRENGFDYPVRCEVAEIEFDKRVYGSVTMPAGTYTALQISIGKAEGKNWWCVMYPPLCLPAVTNTDEVLEQAEEDGILTSDEIEMLKNPSNYEIRFYFADKIKELYNYIKCNILL